MNRPPETTKIDPFDPRGAPLFRRMLREMVRPYVWHMAGAVFFMTLFAAMGAMMVWILDPVVNKVFVEKQAGRLVDLGVAVFAIFLLKSIASYAQEVIMGYVGQRIVADTQNRLFDHLLDQDVAMFQTKHSGALISHFTYDINAMRGAVSNSLIGLGRDLLSVIFLLGVMLVEDWQLTLMTLVAAPLTVYPIGVLGRRMRKVSEATQDQMGGLTTGLSQAFQGIRMIKAYGMEPYERGKVGKMVETILDLNVRGIRIRAATQPLIDLFGGIVIAAVIIYTGTRVVEGTLTPGAFFAFIAAAMAIYQPMRALSKINTYIQEGLAAAERIFRILDTKPAIHNAEGAKTLPREAGAVVFDNVHFSYDGEVAALAGLTMEAPAGKVTAMVGSSGAGKSTVLNLIPRFYDPERGSVVVNGEDIRGVTIESLRGSIAVVSQEVVLFDDTIMANIRYGRPNATDEEVFSAAQSAAAHGFISETPDGYNTIVGEHGMKLSGGQRQRLAIARAMLKNAPILLLDEATSALDTESERHVQKALDELMEGRTTMVIAHRFSTVVNADVIHVVDKGKLVETGTHDELMAEGGQYAKLYELQFAPEAEQQGAEREPVPA